MIQEAKKKKDNGSFLLLCPNINENENYIQQDQNPIIIVEPNRYRAMKLNIDDQSFPLNFYNNNQHILPNLIEIAKIVFYTTASSVPSECTFSAAGLLINKKRSRLAWTIFFELDNALSKLNNKISHDEF